MAPSRPPNKAFDKDERVLCFHGPLLYDAKIIEAEPVDINNRKGLYHYKVHYRNWKATWDDWVPEERLRRYNDENRETQSNLKKQLKEQDEAQQKKTVAPPLAKRKSGIGAASERGSFRASEERSSSVPAPIRGTKRGRDFDVEKEEAFQSRPSINLAMPDQLKGLLVDDWENVTKSLMLVPLPHKHPVNEILADYAAYESEKRREGSAEADILQEVVAGIRDYFDKSLGRILLYRFERQQWLEIHEQMITPPEAPINKKKKGAENLGGKAPSDVYGAEHLCRLFVTFPDLVAQTNMDQPSVNHLRDEIVKLARWLSARSRDYFADKYENAGGEYADEARGA